MVEVFENAPAPTALALAQGLGRSRGFAATSSFGEKAGLLGAQILHLIITAFAAIGAGFVTYSVTGGDVLAAIVAGLIVMQVTGAVVAKAFNLPR